MLFLRIFCLKRDKYITVESFPKTQPYSFYPAIIESDCPDHRKRRNFFDDHQNSICRTFACVRRIFLPCRKSVPILHNHCCALMNRDEPKNEIKSIVKIFFKTNCNTYHQPIVKYLIRKTYFNFIYMLKNVAQHYT